MPAAAGHLSSASPPTHTWPPGIQPGGLFYAIGNPLSDGTWQYDWINGRQLARVYSVDTDASFVHNENGLRVRKAVNGLVTNYTLHGKNIVHMTQGSNNLHFFYDAQNKPAIVEYNGTRYAYMHNLQGDIVAILDGNGTAVVQYKYDAWGKPINKTGSMKDSLGKLNPFRYRGYVYDEETGMYYLRSRYYHSAWGRFVNADSVIKGNLFAYCNNNPVFYSDSEGMDPYPMLDKDKNRDRNRHSLSTEKMPVNVFVDYLRQAADEEWKYVYGYAQYKTVDCVGLHKYIFEWYYTSSSFSELMTIRNNRHKEGKKYNQVIDMIDTGIVGGFGDIYDICYTCDIPPVGTAVFIYDPDSSMANEINQGWVHVGYMIGKTEYFEYTVIEADSISGKVKYSDLLTSNFNCYGYLRGIDYTK